MDTSRLTPDYVAGQFDGDGSVCCFTSGGTTPYISAIVASAYLPCLQMYAEKYGGGIDKLHGTTKKNVYIWRIGAVRDCYDFFHMIEDLSMEKQAQVKVALEWLKTRIVPGKRGNQIPVDKELALQIRRTLKRMKKIQPSMGDMNRPLPSDQYFGGYFDAEGCVRCFYANKNTSLATHCIIGSCNQGILSLFQRRFGGSLLKTWSVGNFKSYQWHVCSLTESSNFLRTIQHHSIEKREQIDVALRWLDHRLQFPIEGKHLPLDLDLRSETHDRLKSLKAVSY